MDNTPTSIYKMSNVCNKGALRDGFIAACGLTTMSVCGVQI